MKRLIWGIFLAVFGVLCFASAGNNPQGPEGSIIFGAICSAGGGLLIYFGASYLKRRDAVGELALGMLRRSGKIDTAELATCGRFSEMTVRELLLDLQRKGLVPLQVEVV